MGMGASRLRPPQSEPGIELVHEAGVCVEVEITADAAGVAPRGLPVSQAFTRCLLRRSILATPAEGAKMLVRPSSQRTR